MQGEKIDESSVGIVPSVKKNIVANYASQFYVTLIGIVMVPFYIRYMGAEAYGLVGFYAMLQSWFMLLDMGLTPTLERETARFRGGATDRSSYFSLFRILEEVFFVVSIAGGLAMFAASGYISQYWLNASMLPDVEIQAAVQIMAFIIAMRWMGGLYRGTVVGSERLGWLAGFNSVLATVRFVGVVPLLMFVGATPTLFFSFQLCIAAIELLVLIVYAYRLLPVTPDRLSLSIDFRPIQRLLRFSLTLAFTSSVWVMTMQMDKLVLSKILPLAEYGYYSLSVLVASAVIMISNPVRLAIMPRLTRSEAENDTANFITVYRKATQLVSVVAGSATITLAFFAEPVLFAWTGDSQLARKAAPVLMLYAMGNGLLALAGFSYYMQYAKGNLRLHFFWSVGSLVMLIPAVIWAAQHYGGIGAGYVWLGLNLLSFIFLLPLVHHKFVPGLNRRWYLRDVLAIVVCGTLSGGVASQLMRPDADRWFQLFEVTAAGFVVLLSSAAASSEVRALVKRFGMIQRQRFVANFGSIE